jgi:hypothetical protein
VRGKVVLFTIALIIALSVPAAAVTIGQIDTFETGTTEGWVAGGGPLGQNPPVPPFVESSGGPGGADDQFLVITSQGGMGPGSRLTAFNINGQWADNYLTNGIGGIAMDLRNLGQTELTIRLEFEDPFIGGNFAVTNTGITLAPGSGWTHAVFPIDPSQFTALGGTVAGALANTAVLRILHATGATDAQPIAGVLGVDNIAAVPEPATGALIAGGLLAAAAIRRRLTRGQQL